MKARDAAAAGPEEQVDLARYLDAALSRALEQRLVPGDPGADDQKVGTVQVFRAVAAEPGGDPSLGQLGPKLWRVGPVDDAHGSASLGDEGCRRAAAAPVADDEGVAAARVDHAVCPGRASANASAAAMSEPAQK